MLLIDVNVKSSKTSDDSSLMASLSQVRRLVLPFKLLLVELLELWEDMLDPLDEADGPALELLDAELAGLNFSTVVDT